jgi:hypothetical protein
MTTYKLMEEFTKYISHSEPKDSDLCFLMDVYKKYRNYLNEKDETLNTLLKSNPPYTKVLNWFKENINNFDEVLEYFKLEYIGNEVRKNICRYNDSVKIFPPESDEIFVGYIYYKHVVRFNYIDDSKEKQYRLYSFLLTNPDNYAVVEWFKTNISDWETIKVIYLDGLYIKQEIDKYMTIFEQNISAYVPVNADIRKVISLYNHYKRLNEGFLNYSYELHKKFHTFILTNPPSDDVIKWFSVNVFEWHRTKYEMTNGRMDWRIGGCFADTTKILMADDTLKEIQYIKKGDRVKLPNGESTEVECVINWTTNMNCVTVNDKLVITPWHPIKINNEWVFPINYTNNPIQQKRKVYNLVLTDGHIVIADGIEACTLAHGFTDNEVIRHTFYGTNKVIEALNYHDPIGWETGIIKAKGIIVDENENIIGFACH